MTEKQLLKKAAKDIENLIKAKIKERNLIKTGRMYNSIKCTMDSSLSLSIKAVDYFQFVNERYNILGEVENTYEYQEIFEELMDELIGAEFGKDRKYKI